ncbi:hypothetical protein chiPu_0011847 [Chiloscyllium punctatum]|uniref:Uncharacterized protein n=1 Tax=Chiloscyllium punctatum TaxID=137246 RepID=A0A401SSM1_CHIPU|nr:hypothetical protein [Chiloscyllium punctatum]
MAPALTETATEPHGFQLLSSSLSSSSIEPDTFFHEEEQKLNRECNTQSTWSQLAYPFATYGLGSDAPDLKHVPYGSITYVSFSKALLLHVKESVDSDATSSSTEEDTDSEEIALNRNMPFKYRSERRWIID